MFEIDEMQASADFLNDARLHLDNFLNATKTFTEIKNLDSDFLKFYLDVAPPLSHLLQENQFLSMSKVRRFVLTLSLMYESGLKFLQNDKDNLKPKLFLVLGEGKEASQQILDEVQRIDVKIEELEVA